MTLEASLYTTFGPLVGNRFAPKLPQPPAIPTWPAIRYTIETLAVVDICGDGTDDTAETTVIMEIIALTYTAARALRLQVLAAAKTFDPPMIAGFNRGEDDADTKTWREIQEFTVHGSSSS